MTYITSGYWLAIADNHKGYKAHFESIKSCMKTGLDRLIVVINNENQQVLKYGKVIKNIAELKKYITENIVPDAVISIDTDRTVCRTLEMLSKQNDSVTFIVDADTPDNFPEKETCNKNNIQILYLRNLKIDSSSKILNITKN